MTNKTSKKLHENEIHEIVYWVIKEHGLDANPLVVAKAIVAKLKESEIL